MFHVLRTRLTSVRRKTHLISQMEVGNAVNAAITTSREESSASDAKKKRIKMTSKENQPI
jgi:hypothetical protein